MSSEAVSINASAGKLRYLMVTAVLLALDQITKYWVSITFQEGDEGKDVIPGFFKLSYTENPGIAFGMLNSGEMRWVLVAISVVAIIVVIYYLMRTSASSKLLLWSLAFLAAGISGNLIDRIRLGRVIDFILLYYKTYDWPVFNIADTAITIGAALMAIELFISPQAEPQAASERDESSKTESGQQ
ncbi:MAG TPA: signal peptidase II [Blastocatellia bacterium]|jgi:signal peptidase II